MSYVDIKNVPWPQLRADVQELCVRHWAEIARNRELIKLKPAWHLYDQMHNAGILSCTEARDPDGSLVGYTIYIVMPHLHYADSLTAFADVLYLVPERRQGSTGIRLIRIAEEGLRVRGVQRVMQNVKPSNDWSPILKRMGFTEFEMIYQKILEK